MPPWYLPSSFSSSQKSRGLNALIAWEQLLLCSPSSQHKQLPSCASAGRGVAVPPLGTWDCMLGTTRNQHNGPACGQGPGLNMSFEGRRYFGGEKYGFNCLDEGGLCFMDVWGLGRCSSFSVYDIVQGKKKWIIYLHL